MDLIGRSCLGITFVLERLSVRRTLRRVDRMLREGCVRFQMVGVQSASPRIACGRMVLERVRSALAHALALYFAEPLKHCITDPSADSRFLDAVLNRGDVLFTEGNTRAAVLVKRLTRSRRSHVFRVRRTARRWSKSALCRRGRHCSRCQTNTTIRHPSPTIGRIAAYASY